MIQFRSKHRNAFTLVELLLAMSILALVTVSVFSMLDVVTSAYKNGLRSMGQYQTARVALRRVAEEVRFALSPAAFWRPPDRYELMDMDAVMMQFGGRLVPEEEPGPILFQGKSNSLLFTRKKFQFGKNPPFDLQECVIEVDGERNELVLRVIRSVLQVKRMAWLFSNDWQTPLQGIVFDKGGRQRFRPMGPDPNEPPMATYTADAGWMNERYVFADKVKEIKFGYSEGGGFGSSWDSQKLIREYRKPPESENFNFLQDVRMRDQGPPPLVKITLTMMNGEELTTATDVPAGNMMNLGGFFGNGPVGGAGGQTLAPPGNAVSPRNETGTTVPGLPGAPIIPHIGNQ